MLTQTTMTDFIKYVKAPYTNQPLKVFSKLHQHYKTVYLLESIEGPQKLAQYSFIGFDPAKTIQVKNGKATIINHKTEKKTTRKTSNPLKLIQEQLQPYGCHGGDFRFIGGAVGYISYDMIRYIEKLPEHAIDELDFPDVEMGIFEDGFVFDHIKNQAYYYYRSENRLKEVEELFKKPSRIGELSFTEPKVNVSKEDFEKAVEVAKKYVIAGDIFQVVLSKRYQFQFEGSLLEFYKSLRSINPSPYMFYFKSGPRQIIGSSPEMLVRVDNRKVETFPIAGAKPPTPQL